MTSWRSRPKAPPPAAPWTKSPPAKPPKPRRKKPVAEKRKATRRRNIYLAPLTQPSMPKAPTKPRKASRQKSPHCPAHERLRSPKTPSANSPRSSPNHLRQPVAARNEIRRLSHALQSQSRQSAFHQPQRPRLDRPHEIAGRARRRARGQGSRLRRRSRRARFQRRQPFPIAAKRLQGQPACRSSTTSSICCTSMATISPAQRWKIANLCLQKLSAQPDRAKPTESASANTSPAPATVPSQNVPGRPGRDDLQTPRRTLRARPQPVRGSNANADRSKNW